MGWMPKMAMDTYIIFVFEYKKLRKCLSVYSTMNEHININRRKYFFNFNFS